VATRLSFDWDEANISHVARHGVTQAEAEEIVRGAAAVVESDRHGESRAVVIGDTAGGRTLVVVFAARKERVRIVTAYPANRSQRARYRRHRR
jgi:uncharacterized DUF497 family protein